MTTPETLLDPQSQIQPETLGMAPGRGRLEGRNLLVVGAGQRDDGPGAPLGNGRAIALLAAREGAALACADRDSTSAGITADLIEEANGRAMAMTVDVADPEQVRGMVVAAREELGQLDGLVLNVGISQGLSLEKMTVDAWDLDFNVNLRSHMLACQVALEVMEPGSSIVLMSSLASQRPTGRNPAYEASKAGQIALGKSVALTGQARGIRCNVVAPGLIDTPLGRLASSARPGRAARVPFGRQGTAWEVAYATLFLLSGESSYINGETLFVDGGLGQGIAR